MSERAQAAKEVIRLKQQYSQSDGKDFHGSDKANELANRAVELRGKYGLDESRYGSEVGLADALTNFAKDFGGGSGQQVNQEEPRYEPPTRGGGSSFDSDAAFKKYEDTMRSGADSMRDSQFAEIDRAYEGEIAALEMAYEKAISEGKISVREAERQFEAQKQEIHQLAYQQSEATKAQASNRGIVNSQQMIGLQQGDNARVREVHSANMSDRDNRINEIKDRIAMISAQKDLDIGRAKAQKGHARAGAQAQSDASYMQSMGDFMAQDYFARQGQDHERGMQYDRFGHDDYMSDKTHGQNIDIEYIRQNNTLAQMAEQHGYNLDSMSQEQLYRLETMEQENTYFVENTVMQHNLGLERLEQEILGQLRTIDRSAHHVAVEGDKNRRHQTSERIGSQNFRASESARAFSRQIRAEENRYQSELQRRLKGITPGTKEHRAITGEFDMQLKSEKKTMTNQFLNEYSLNSIISNPNLPEVSGKTLSKPRDYTAGTNYGLSSGSSTPSIFGSALNKFTGFETQTSNYNKQQEAIRRKKGLLSGSTSGGYR